MVGDDQRQLDAALLGALVFRQRVRGAYFAILSQALAAAFVILLVGQQGLTGGTNGLTNFFELFGLDMAAPATQRGRSLAVAVEAPEIRIDTVAASVEAAADRVIARLRELGLIE